MSEQRQIHDAWKKAYDDAINAWQERVTELEARLEQAVQALRPRLQPLLSRVDGFQWCTECSSLIGLDAHRDDCPYVLCALSGGEPR